MLEFLFHNLQDWKIFKIFFLLPNQMVHFFKNIVIRKCSVSLNTSILISDNFKLQRKYQER